MGRLLQFLAFLFVARYVFRALAHWLTEGSERQRVGGPGAGSKPVYRGRMVRDPVCGLFLLEERAIEDHLDGETQHFCSEKCRETFKKTKATGVMVG
jgi:YHS domain-containing protein